MGWGPPRHFIPSDAQARNIDDGDQIKVTSRAGTVEARAELTDAIMPGVVSLPHGHGDVSLNDLTDDEATDPLTGVAVLNGVPVELEGL